MASSICQNLLETVWRSYADDLAKAPEAEGIYTIGVERAGDVRYLYVGQTDNIRRRLQQHHKYQTSEIDMFVQKQFSQRNAGKTLRIKWVEERNSECAEGSCLQCMEEKIGYWPDYNRKGRNQCKFKSH